jgi:hypothetical protein
MDYSAWPSPSVSTIILSSRFIGYDSTTCSAIMKKLTQNLTLKHR